MGILSLKQLRETAPAHLQEASDEELIVAYSESTGQEPHRVAEYFGIPTGRGGNAFTTGVSSGVDQAQGLVTSAGAALADVAGLDDARDALLRSARGQQYESLLASNPEIAQRVEDIDSVSGAFSYGLNQLGKQVPIMGGILGAGALGGPVGAAAAGYTYGVGSLYDEQVEAGDPNAALAFGLGVPYAAAETLVPLGLGRALGLRKLQPKTEKDMLSTSKKPAKPPSSRPVRAGKAGVAASVTEAATELVQTELEMSQNPNLTPEERFSRRLNAAVAGALVGGVAGAGAGALQAPTGAPTEETTEETDVAISDAEREQLAEDSNILAQESLDQVAEFDSNEAEQAASEEVLNILHNYTDGRISGDERQKTKTKRTIVRNRLTALDEEVAEAEAALEAAQNDTQGAKILERLEKELGEVKRQATGPLDKLDEIRKKHAPKIASLEAKISAAQEALDDKLSTAKVNLEITRANAEARRAELVSQSSELSSILVNDDRAGKVAEWIKKIQKTGRIPKHVLELVNEYKADLAAQAAVQAEKDAAWEADLPAQATVQAEKDAAWEAQQEEVAPQEAPAPVEEVTPATDTEAVEAAIESDLEEVDQKVIDDSNEAAAAAEKLNVEVVSEKGKVSGRNTLPQPFLAAAARHLRSPDEKGSKNILVGKTAAIDKAATEENADKLDEIRAAYHRILAVGGDFTNAVSNVLNITGDQESEMTTGALRKRGDAAMSAVETRQSYLPDVQRAVQDFINAAGSEANANAIIASIKNMSEKKSGVQNTLQGEKLNWAKSLFSTIEGGGKRELDTHADFAQAADSIVSPLFSAYIDGRLDENYDIAPVGREIRPNLKDKDRAARTKSGIDVSQKDLESAYNKGYAPNKQPRSNDPEWTGLVGIVNRADTGTSSNITSNMLAKTIRRVLNARANYKDKNGKGIPEPTVKFVGQEGAADKASYNPVSDTITFDKESSPEVILHEVLHALLQGLVYRHGGAVKGFKPDASIAKTIDVLKAYVNDIINFDINSVTNMTGAQRLVAADVQTELRNIVDRGGKNAELNAVLELLSYGNTLRDFKILLANMPQSTNKAAISWNSTVRRLWEQIRRVFNKVLGVQGKAANQIIDASVELLEAAKASPADTTPVEGDMLYYGATKVDPNLTQFGTESTYGLTKPLFNAAAGVLPKGLGKRKTELANQVRDYILGTKRIEPILRKMNTYYAFGEVWKQIFKTFKAQSQTPIIVANNVSAWIQDAIVTDVKLARDMFTYMDNKWANITEGKAMVTPDSLNNEGFEVMLGRMDELIEAYHSQLDAIPKSARTFFRSRKFSEALLYVEDHSDVATSGVGLHSLDKVLRNRKQTEVNLEEDWVFRNDDDAFDSLGDYTYYQVVKEVGGFADPSKHEGYVRSDIADDGTLLAKRDAENFAVLKDVKWSAVPNKDGSVTFVANTSVSEILKDDAGRKEADKVAAAIRNTMSTLSSYSASKNFFRALVNAVDSDTDGRVASVWSSLKDLQESGLLGKYTAKDGKQYNKEAIIDDQKTKLTASEQAKLDRGEARRVIKSSVEALRTAELADVLRQSGTWVLIPSKGEMDADSDLPAEVWGELAGKIIPGPLYSSILDMSRGTKVFDNKFMRRYNGLLRQFKLSKTTRNPGTHATNTASNVTLMMVHGISPAALKEAAVIMYKASRNPGSLKQRGKLTDKQLAILKEFEKSGAMLGSFSVVEVKQQHYKDMASTLNPDVKDGAGNVLEMLKLAQLKDSKAGKFLGATDRTMLDLYAAEDNVFRLAAFMKKAGELQNLKGSAELTPEEWAQAGQFGRESFLDYDIDSVYLQFARQTIMPFASWTYAVTPVLYKIAMTKPWMIANVLMSYAMIDTFMSALAGDDEDTRKSLGAMYDERLFFGMGPHSHIRMPFLGDDNQPVYWRLGDYIPLSSTMRGSPNGFFGAEWWPGGLAFNGPLFTLGAMALNIDAYTGKKMYEDTDTTLDAGLKTFGTLYDMFAPPFANTRVRDQGLDYLYGNKTVSGQDPTPLWFLRAFGLKFYDPYVSDEQMFKKFQTSATKREYGKAISKLQRDTMRAGSPDWDEFGKKVLELRTAMQETIDEINKVDQ